jgi:hypothetical protein
MIAIVVLGPNVILGRQYLSSSNIPFLLFLNYILKRHSRATVSFFFKYPFSIVFELHFKEIFSGDSIFLLLQVPFSIAFQLPCKEIFAKGKNKSSNFRERQPPIGAKHR